MPDNVQNWGLSGKKWGIMSYNFKMEGSEKAAIVIGMTGYVYY